MLKDIAPKGGTKSVRHARRLRAKKSLPEVLLWQGLRQRPNGLKFRRQHPSGPFVLDFYCVDVRLAIEVDGEAHGLEHRPVRDEARDRWFRETGIETLRIPAADVLKDMGAVFDQIMLVAAARLPLHHPAMPGGSPPRDKLGED